MEVKIGDLGLATQVSISEFRILICDILSVCRLITTASERKSGVGRGAISHLRCLARRDTVMRLKLFIWIIIDCRKVNTLVLARELSYPIVQYVWRGWMKAFRL